MNLEFVASVLSLGGGLWALGFLLPRARRAHDGFGILCAVLAAVVSLAIFLLVGIRAR